MSNLVERLRAKAACIRLAIKDDRVAYAHSDDANVLDEAAAALSRQHAILSAVMDVEKAEPTGDPYDPASWASSAKSVVAGSEHDRVRAQRDRAEATVTAWASVVEGIEAHIQDRIAMGDDANPQTYLEIIQANVRDVKRSSEQMIASRWASEKRLRDALSRAEAQRDALQAFKGETP